MSVSTRAPEQLGGALDRVTASVVALAGAEEEYGAALVAAVDAGASYAAVARAAGVSRQAVRQFVLDERRAS